MICSICTEICNNHTIMGCGHKFHEDCLMNWLRINNSCPNCRLNDPSTKQYYLQAEICGCGSCTLLFTPDKIKIWICNNRIPLCPHCCVDCVFSFSKDFSVERISKFLKAINTRSFGGMVSLENTIIKIEGEAVVVMNNGLILTTFYRSPSFNEYFEMS